MLVLASRSPRRREILERAGIPCTVRAGEVHEARGPGEDPWLYAKRLARAKAESVELRPGEIVLGADTIVVVGHDVLEKPADGEDAVRMLRLLSGRQHLVITGFCLRDDEDAVVDTETSRVRFVPLYEREIREYVASGEPMDKAGAYAIQGLASKFIDRIEGCYFNVVGLPIAAVYRHLKLILARRN
jgi:septum formation protein